MPTTFVALFAGPSFQAARVVGTTSDPALVRLVATQLLESLKASEVEPTDPVTAALQQGKRRALCLVSGREEGCDHD